MKDQTPSPEEQEIQQIVNEATHDTAQREAAIKNLHSNNGPQLKLTGGIIGANSPHQKQQDEQQYKSEIKGIREAALNNAAKAIEGSPINIQAKSYKTADDFAYPETSSQNNSASKRGEKKDLESAQNSTMQQLGDDVPMQDREAAEKDISPSQDLAMRKLGDAKEKNALNPSPKPDNKFKEASMSQRFDMSLGYSKMNKPIEKETEKPGPSKMSMSDKFLTSLSNSKPPEPTSPTPPKDAKPKGSKGKDMD